MEISINDDGTKILLAQLAKAKIKKLLEKSGTNEISAVGTVEKEDNIFKVTDIFVLKQAVSGGRTEMDDDAVNEFYAARLADNTFDKVRLWWHSHNNMGVFWSGPDKEVISDMASGADWWISIVSNNSGQHKGRIDLGNPISITMDNVPVISDNYAALLSEERKAELEALNKELIKDKFASYVVSDYYQYNGSNYLNRGAP